MATDLIERVCSMNSPHSAPSAVRLRTAVASHLVLALVIATAHALAAPQDARARAADAYQRAIQLEQKGDAAGALTLLWEAAGLAPDDSEIQNRLGEALERVGALDAAIEAYRAAVTARPSFRKASNNLILALVRAGRSQEAVERARAEVAAAPDDPGRHFTLGLAQSEPDVEGAIASFRRALALAPRHTLARYNLALVLKRADRLDEAIDELTRVLDTEPRAEASYTLGVIRLHRGELDRAAAALRAAIAAQPAYADAHYTLGAVLQARRDWRGAAAALRRAIALRTDLSGAHYTLGRVLQSAGDAAGARAHFAEAERLRERERLEREARVLTSVGTGRLDAGDAAGGVEAFRRAIAILDTYAPAHYQMGRALQRLGQHDAARTAFARARQLNPSLVPPGEFRQPEPMADP
jgi:tetratricopeptide (TPR) repeat protein